MNVLLSMVTQIEILTFFLGSARAITLQFCIIVPNTRVGFGESQLIYETKLEMRKKSQHSF